MIDTDDLRAAVLWLQTTLARQSRSAGIIDFAVVGNASGHYHWTPSYVADVDVWILAESFAPSTGGVLTEVLQSMRQLWSSKGFSVIWKAINGPYKPVWSEGDEPIIFIHLILDTADTIRSRNPFMLRAWSKYECAFRKDRLVELGKQPLTVDDLKRSDRGPRHGAWLLSQRSISFPAFSLPSLARTSFDLQIGGPESYELCFYLAGTNARNHARVRGFLEPDRLNHKTFGFWYIEHVMKSAELQDVLDWKMQFRRGNVAVEFDVLRTATKAYLRDLDLVCA